MKNYKKRIAEEKFLRMSSEFPVVLVTGARQIGKTTMLENLNTEDKRTYVTLDDFHIRDMAINDPVLFFQNFPPPIIIDEIQYAPNLFSQIKLICDQNQNMGEFWLTGSQSYALIKDVSETLAGRVGIIEMSSFTIDESFEQINQLPLKFELADMKERFKQSKPYTNKELFEFIYRGGMPKTFDLSNESLRDYFNSYVRTYLMRDVMELGKITDTVRFNRFLVACAAMLSNQVNFATLASAADISQPTAKEWLNLLQGLGIVYLVQPYFNNQIKRLVKSPKLYFYDTGLAAHLSLWPSSETLKIGNMNGAYFENFCMNQIIKKIAFQSEAVNVFYYRDVDQNEVDLVLEMHDGLTPIEFKLSANPKKGDVTKFTILERLGKAVLPGAIICMIDKPLLVQDENMIIPASIL